MSEIHGSLGLSSPPVEALRFGLTGFCPGMPLRTETTELWLSPLSCTSSEICWKSSRGAVASFLSCVAEMSSNVDDGAAGAPTAPAPQHARRTDRRSSDHALRLILRFKTGRLTIVMPLSTSSHACRLRAWPRESSDVSRPPPPSAASRDLPHDVMRILDCWKMPMSLMISSCMPSPSPTTLNESYS